MKNGGTTNWSGQKYPAGTLEHGALVRMANEARAKDVTKYGSGPLTEDSTELFIITSQPTSLAEALVVTSLVPFSVPCARKSVRRATLCGFNVRMHCAGSARCDCLKLPKRPSALSADAPGNWLADELARVLNSGMWK